MSVTASEARNHLFALIEQVNEDHVPVEITSRRGDAVLMSRADYDALGETAHLLRVPANARHLVESLEQARRGNRGRHPNRGPSTGASIPELTERCLPVGTISGSVTVESGP